MKRVVRKAAFVVLGSVMAAGAPAFAVTCMNPSQVPSVTVSKNEVCWSPMTGSPRYDAIVGLSLARLRSAAPGLSQALYACLVSAQPVTCASVPYDPPVGDGYFFLVRAKRGNSAASYSTDCATESAGRDAAIAISALCP